MKRIINRLLLLPFIALAASGCSDDSLVFEHEKPQFETNSSAILLEVLLPSSSVDTDQFYIVGDFNGGTDAAVGNAMWQLQKATTGINKWGIYLDPSAFVGGKSLADGFYFYSVAQGEERSIRNEKVNHTLNVSTGSRTNVWVEQWETYFGERPREGSRVYLFDQVGWGDLALYWWGTGLPVTTSWPGITPTGTETIDGIKFSYFDIDAALNGLVLNLIPNNGKSGNDEAKIEDSSVAGWTVDGDFYLALTEDGGVVMDPDNLVIPYDGHKVYVDDRSGWDGLALFAWHNYSPVDAAYPGWQVSGTEVINGVEYKYFALPEAMNDKAFSLVFNNNKAASSADRKEVQGPAIETFGEDVYYKLTANGFEVANPFGIERKIYVDNLSDWGAAALHYWGDGVTATTWPGLQPSGTEEIGEVTYTVFTLPGELDGKSINFILNNNNNGVQLAGYYLDPVNRDYFFRIPANPVHEETAPEQITFKVYIDDQSTWQTLAVYTWGDAEFFGGWPGAVITETEVIDGVTYKCTAFPVEAAGKKANLIPNNTLSAPDEKKFEGGVLGGLTVNQNFYFTLTDDGVTVVE